MDPAAPTSLLRSFERHLRRGRRTASTAATYFKVLRILYRWLEEEDDHRHPMAKRRPPIVPDQPVPVVPRRRAAA
jgi:hypothetical protein